MKIISWNVNGIRAVVKKGFSDFLTKVKPDILLLQEIKIDHVARAKVQFDFKDYQEFWHPAERPGYSGTATLIRQGLSVIGVTNGLKPADYDREGRIQTIEMEKFYLVNAYFPNANHELSRLKFKLDFNDHLLKYLKTLGKNKPVILSGDFNVAHREIDLARPKDNVGNAGFTDEERAWMTDFLNSGFIDTYRQLNGNKVQYSWWGYRFNSRSRNVGWRIDYFCVSRKLSKSVKNAFIMNEIMGSDHCPVGIEIKNNS
jgi:exodeoxyribonuclease III